MTWYRRTSASASSCPAERSISHQPQSDIAEPEIHHEPSTAHRTAAPRSSRVPWHPHGRSQSAISWNYRVHRSPEALFWTSGPSIARLPPLIPAPVCLFPRASSWFLPAWLHKSPPLPSSMLRRHPELPLIHPRNRTLPPPQCQFLASGQRSRPPSPRAAPSSHALANNGIFPAPPSPPSPPQPHGPTCSSPPPPASSPRHRPKSRTSMKSPRKAPAPSSPTPADSASTQGGASANR